MKQVWKAIDNWFFGHGSPVTIGVFRAIIGALCFANLAMILPFFEDWFTERGFVPVALNDRYLGQSIDFHGLAVPRINLLAGATDSGFTLGVYLATMAACLLMSLGLFSRVATVLAAIGLVTLHHRNALILHGGDTILRVSILYLALAPTGAAFSLDRLLARRAGKAPEQPAQVSLWPQRLMQVQISVVYLTTVWHKWGGHYWRDGTAIWYPLNLNEFDRFPIPDWMLTAPAVMAATYATLFTQLGLATLSYCRPFRKWILLAGVGVHLFIEYAFNIPLFAFLMISTYVTFYEGEEIAAWWDRVKNRFGNRNSTSSKPKAAHV